MKTIEYKRERTHHWPAGEWDNEPDKKQWLDESTGLPCLINRNYLGALCGYVGVSKEHTLFGKDYDAPEVEVHGGLTFSGLCQTHEKECDGVCHKVGPGEDENIWWFGFDCHHGWDLAPHDLDDEYARMLFRPDGVYRNFAYVEKEIESLARQLAEREVGI